MLDKQISDLKSAQKDAQEIFLETNQHPRVLSLKNASTFFSKLRYSISLTFQEKEIILFAALQWPLIMIGYILWTKGLLWIPDDVWNNIGKESNKDSENLANLIILGWSFAVIVIISYPISVFSAAIVASQYLQHSNQESTIAKCVAIGFRNTGRLWIFTAIDAWITCSAILDRMPKKNNRRTALNELLYYAWKIGTSGVLPALVAGKTFLEAAKDSVTILRKEPLQIIGIRMGYSLICWIVGILAYIISVLYIFDCAQRTTVHYIYNSYLLMVVPIFFSVGIISVLVRPHFLIMMSKLYNEIIPIDHGVTDLEKEGGFDLFFTKMFLVFFVLFFAVLAFFYFFGDRFFNLF